MWGPLIINWFINPINYRYIYNKPQLLKLQTNLANYGAPHCTKHWMFKSADPHFSPRFLRHVNWEDPPTLPTCPVISVMLRCSKTTTVA